MRKRILPLLLLPLLLMGCGSDSLADRIYAQALGISGEERLTLTLQSSEDEDCRTVRAASLSEAFRLEEAQAGGRVFVGHTELICLDRSVAPDTLRELFYEDGISPACKLLYAPPSYLQTHDSTPLVHTLRLAEKDGLLARTDLASALDEWLGAYRTALVPVQGSLLPGFVLLHENGTCTRLSDRAAAGMLWLREPPHKTSVTLGTQQVELRDIRLRKRLENGTPVYTLTVRAQGCDAKDKLRSRLLAECQAAAEAMVSANADVIGLQTLLESGGRPLPAELPEVAVRVVVEA